jgi:hypothetical protein
LIVDSSGLLSNDIDIEGDQLIITGHTNSMSGTLAINPGGTFIYTPTLNFYGQDWFTYTVSDGGLTGTATAVISVTAVNDAPIAISDIFTTTFGTPLVIDAPGILENDYDVDSEQLTVMLISNPSAGTVSMDPNGSFRYFPAPGFLGLDSLTYRVSDGHSNSIPVVVEINVIRGTFLVHLPTVTRSDP